MPLSVTVLANFRARSLLSGSVLSVWTVVVVVVIILGVVVGVDWGGALGGVLLLELGWEEDDVFRVTILELWMVSSSSLCLCICVMKVSRETDLSVKFFSLS